MADSLSVWLHGDRVAVIEEERGRLRLSYTEEALQRYPLGTPLLSLSLPLTAERYTQGIVRPYLDGLLPEGAARRAVAERFEVVSTDAYGLIRAIGRECAGAVVIQPASDPPPPTPTTLTAERVSDTEIADLVANLPSAPLGIDRRMRVSLGGVQEKLLLTRMVDGAWGRPVDGTPSTHILKPEVADYPATVENEAFCMRFAKHLGLPVAHVETTAIGGRKVLVVERYDRIVRPNGDVERLHQEDLCQATATSPEKKYQDDGGPSLRRIASVLDVATSPRSLDALTRMTALNVLVGNGDAHAKNFSLLHGHEGVLRLAPAYDVLSTLHYGDEKLAMHVDDVRQTNRVTGERFINEVESWGVSRRQAMQVLADLVDGVPAALEAARDETPGVPDELLELIKNQVALLGRER